MREHSALWADRMLDSRYRIPDVYRPPRVEASHKFLRDKKGFSVRHYILSSYFIQYRATNIQNHFHDHIIRYCQKFHEKNLTTEVTEKNFFKNSVNSLVSINLREFPLKEFTMKDRGRYRYGSKIATY